MDKATVTNHLILLRTDKQRVHEANETVKTAEILEAEGIESVRGHIRAEATRLCGVKYGQVLALHGLRTVLHTTRRSGGGWNRVAVQKPIKLRIEVLINGRINVDSDTGKVSVSPYTVKCRHATTQHWVNATEDEVLRSLTEGQRSNLANWNQALLTAACLWNEQLPGAKK